RAVRDQLRLEQRRADPPGDLRRERDHPRSQDAGRRPAALAAGRVAAGGQADQGARVLRRRRPGPADQAVRHALGAGAMLFMIIERFKAQDPLPVYRRVRDAGRLLPPGLTYVDSWVEASFGRCFQLMECDDARLLQQWIIGWRGAG